MDHDLDASFLQHSQWFSYGKDCTDYIIMMLNLESIKPGKI